MNQQLKDNCLKALKGFIEDSSNENKMELYLVFDDIEEQSQETILGKALYTALDRILRRNDHPDTYLDELKQLFFS